MLAVYGAFPSFSFNKILSFPTGKKRGKDLFGREDDVPLKIDFRARCLMDNDNGGMDSEGNAYANRKAMWSEEAGEDPSNGFAMDCQKKQLWYRKGVGYWEGVEASVNGVLGGYGRVSSPDVRSSDAFLLEVLHDRFDPATLRNRPLVALDCGAGVGRVTKNLLLRRFQEVDLVEPVSHFLDAAKVELLKPSNAENGSFDGHRAVNFFCIPLQDFTPEPQRYDVIWVQWCIGHLTDLDFVAFFQRAKAGLKPGGFFVLKENIAKKGFVVDKADCSVTRSDAYFRDLFKQAGLHLYKTKPQKGFPRELFAVRMYALTEPVDSRSSKGQRTRSQSKNQPGIIF